MFLLHIEKTRKNNIEGLRYLEQELDKMDLNYVKSAANFILIDVGRDGDDVYKKILKTGVIVRPMAGYDFPNFVRVTVGLPEENKRFVEGLREVLK